ncbi:uncharacterized protein [Palaemon carinicauda]|uniref:uncharacterized protein n=1 Tax=Palaemon carinicauda TaxID=392227 RepID=UPI0035B5CB96
MTNKAGYLTKAILVIFKGPHPKKVDLGIFGSFWVKKYYSDPLRCYHCQKFGHHKDQCQAKFPTCAVCSQRNNTQDCIDKKAAGIPTTLKCLNCKKGHTAMAWGCPERVARVIAALPKEKREEPRGRVAPKPLPKRRYYTQEELRKSSRARSSSRAPTTTPQTPKPLPRTIFIKTTFLTWSHKL